MNRKANLEYLMKKFSELKEEERVGIEQTKKQTPITGEKLVNLKERKDSYYDVTDKNLANSLEEIMELEKDIEKMREGDISETKEKDEKKKSKTSTISDLVTLLVYEKIPNKKYANLYQDIVLIALKNFTDL